MIRVLSTAVFCLLCLPALAADIWRTIGEDGAPRYASSKLDPSYTLFMRDDAPPAGEAAKSTLPAARRNLLLRWLPTIEKLSKKHGVELALVLAIVDVESRFNPSATSPKGAAGLMQIMPALAARYGVRNRYDVQQNLEAGILYLKDLHKIHQGNIPLMLASYNAGEYAVARHGKRLPPYRETMLYVPQVMASLAAARELTATASGVPAVP